MVSSQPRIVVQEYKGWVHPDFREERGLFAQVMLWGRSS
jgi:hypothetical protein